MRLRKVDLWKHPSRIISSSTHHSYPKTPNNTRSACQVWLHLTLKRRSMIGLPSKIIRNSYRENSAAKTV